jgi:formylglycine-generating enzyme required for sulfatase activity
MGGTGPDATNAADSGDAADVYATLVAAKKWFGKYGDHIVTSSPNPNTVARENYNGNGWFEINGSGRVTGPSRGTTWVVGSGTGNVNGYGYGLYDMMGNVSEMCWDWAGGVYHGTVAHTGDPGTWWNQLDVDPSVDTQEGDPYKVVRGGSFAAYEIHCRVGAVGGTRLNQAGTGVLSSLEGDGYDAYGNNVGFRVVRNQ